MKHSYKRAFTIIELLLYMAIMSIMLTVLANTFTSIVEVQLESEANSEVEQDGNYIFSRFLYDIPRASSVTTPSSLGGTASSLTISIDGNAYTYAVNNNNLEITTPSGTDVLNSVNTTVSGVSFLRLGKSGGKHSIRLTYTITSTTQQNKGFEIKQYQTTIGLR